MTRINNKSDFKIIERRRGGKALACVPFKFTYFVNMNKAYRIAEYDGKQYIGCTPTDDGLGIIVAINDARLGIGSLKVNREYSVPDNSYSDRICNVKSKEGTGIVLTDGETEAVVVELEVILPFDCESTPDVPLAKVVDGVLVISGMLDNSVLVLGFGSVNNNVLSL